MGLLASIVQAAIFWVILFRSQYRPPIEPSVYKGLARFAPARAYFVPTLFVPSHWPMPVNNLLRASRVSLEWANDLPRLLPSGATASGSPIRLPGGAVALVMRLV